MSYWISLNDKNGDCLISENVIAEGGTHAISGTDEMCMNVTWNYGKFYRKHIDKDQGIRWLHGKTGLETRDRLVKAVKNMGHDTSDNYWEATEGNARKPLVIFLGWATECPKGIWRVN